MTRPPELSVLVVTYQSGPLIDECLDALAAVAPALSLEVVVVDNGSADDSAARAAAHPLAAQGRLRVLQAGCNLGFSAANNRALALAGGRHLLLLNPDAAPAPGAIERLFAHLEAEPGVGAVGPQLRLADGQLQLECARRLPAPGNLWPWLLLLDKAVHTLRGRRPWPETAEPPPPRWYDGFNLLGWPRRQACAVESLSGACLLVRGSLLRELRGLDERHPMYLDDIDLCRRILDRGFALHYRPEAVVRHRWRQSSAPGRDGDYYALGLHAVWLYLHKHHGAAAAARYALGAALAAGLRLPAAWLLLLLPGGAADERQRRLRMAQGLARWAWRWPKRPPRLGFAQERDEAVAATPEAGRR